MRRNNIKIYSWPSAVALLPQLCQWERPHPARQAQASPRSRKPSDLLCSRAQDSLQPWRRAGKYLVITLVVLALLPRRNTARASWSWLHLFPSIGPLCRGGERTPLGCIRTTYDSLTASVISSKRRARGVSACSMSATEAGLCAGRGAARCELFTRTVTEGRWPEGQVLLSMLLGQRTGRSSHV